MISDQLYDFFKGMDAAIPGLWKVCFILTCLVFLMALYYWYLGRPRKGLVKMRLI